MKNFAVLTAATLAAAAFASASAQTFTPNLNNVELGLNAGYQQGLSGGLTLRAANVAGPIGVRVGIDTARVNDSLNDDANFGGTGTWGQYKQSTGATESGNSTTVGIDATYDLPSQISGVNAYVYGGARYNHFTATADFSNTSSGSTTYTTNQFGLGAGAAIGYAITGNLSVTGDLGVDHYFGSSFSTNTGGADGNGDTFNKGENGYADADTLVNQPTTSFKAKLGLAYRF